MKSSKKRKSEVLDSVIKTKQVELEALISLQKKVVEENESKENASVSMMDEDKDIAPQLKKQLSLSKFFSSAEKTVNIRIPRNFDSQSEIQEIVFDKDDKDEEGKAIEVPRKPKIFWSMQTKVQALKLLKEKGVAETYSAFNERIPLRVY